MAGYWRRKLPCARGVSHAALLGSHARGDARPDSDIDLMVESAPSSQTRRACRRRRRTRSIFLQRSRHQLIGARQIGGFSHRDDQSISVQQYEPTESSTENAYALDLIMWWINSVHGLKMDCAGILAGAQFQGGEATSSNPGQDRRQEGLLPWATEQMLVCALLEDVAVLDNSDVIL